MIAFDTAATLPGVVSPSCTEPTRRRDQASVRRAATTTAKVAVTYSGAPTVTGPYGSTFRAELELPLSESLTAPHIPGVGEIAADEQRVIDRTTRGRL
jgi:hypothetical protein